MLDGQHSGHRRYGSIPIFFAVGMFLTLGVACNRQSVVEVQSDGDKEVAEVVSDKSDHLDGKVLRHAVFFKFKDSSSDEQVKEVVEAFRKLPVQIEEISDFEWGTNNSPEDHDDQYTHCFLLSFDNEEGRNEYLPHDAHVGEFADTLRPHLEKVFVIDYWGKSAKKNLSTKP